MNFHLECFDSIWMTRVVLLIIEQPVAVPSVACAVRQWRCIALCRPVQNCCAFLMLLQRRAVGEFRKLALLAESDGHLRQKLQQVKALGLWEPWDCQHGCTSPPGRRRGLPAECSAALISFVGQPP